jgi:hypothetical protein
MEVIISDGGAFDDGYKLSNSGVNPMLYGIFMIALCSAILVFFVPTILVVMLVVAFIRVTRFIRS